MVVEKGVVTGAYVEVSYDDISREALCLENGIKLVACSLCPSCAASLVI
jgi:hypothetical protein